MQLTVFDGPSEPCKLPTIVVKILNDDHIAIRLRQIGPPQRFNTILGRFRYDFPLANCQEIAGLPWWILAATQYDEIEAFAKRNGLRFLKEQ
jgi:hypothetical protein